MLLVLQTNTQWLLNIKHPMKRQRKATGCYSGPEIFPVEVILYSCYIKSLKSFFGPLWLSPTSWPLSWIKIQISRENTLQTLRDCKRKCKIKMYIREKYIFSPILNVNYILTNWWGTCDTDSYGCSCLCLAGMNGCLITPRPSTASLQ